MRPKASLPRVAYILRSYPRLSQTFVVNEILALEQLGLPIQIFAVTNPQEPIIQSQVAAVQAPVEYLETVQQQKWSQTLLQHVMLLFRAPQRYLKTVWYLLRHQECNEGYTTASRFTCLHYAIYLAHRLQRKGEAGEQPFEHIHAHFAHDPTLIAQLVHKLTGLPFSFTAHARDLYQIPPTALAERIADSTTLVTCCGANVTYIQSVVPTAAWSKLHLIHHGVNLQQFQPASHAHHTTERNTTGDTTNKSSMELVHEGSPPLLLSVGRLVEKKGFPDLLYACALLKINGYHFRCLIYGEGPLHAQLTALISELDLQQHVQLMGACRQQDLIPILQKSDIFVLTPYVTEDGDRDGVPNVLVEAMACGLPVVSTNVGGISELVRDQKNGLLSAAHDRNAIATQLATLLDDLPLRKELGMAARQTVEEKFDIRAAAHKLIAIFRDAAYKEQPTPATHVSTNHTPATTSQ